MGVREWRRGRARVTDRKQRKLVNWSYIFTGSTAQSLTPAVVNNKVWALVSPDYLFQVSFTHSLLTS